MFSACVCCLSLLCGGDPDKQVLESFIQKAEKLERFEADLDVVLKRRILAITMYGKVKFSQPEDISLRCWTVTNDTLLVDLDSTTHKTVEGFDASWLRLACNVDQITKDSSFEFEKLDENYYRIGVKQQGFDISLGLDKKRLTIAAYAIKDGEELVVYGEVKEFYENGFPKTIVAIYEKLGATVTIQIKNLNINKPE